MGVALLWPSTTAENERQMALKVLAAFLRKGFGELHFGRNGTWRIGLEPASDRASLRVGRYARPSRRWGTVLPVVLDRYPKNKAGEDLAALVTQACLNIGLPEQAMDGLDIEIHKYSPIAGAPAVRLVIDSLSEDSPYRGRAVLNIVLTFAGPVRGPLVLGAGRFRGLGFCLPLSESAAS
jgi:CRISPR-associated protein Csb2